MLKDKRCLPCEGKVAKLTLEEAQKLHQEVPEWTLHKEGTTLTREYVFKDFKKALEFVNAIGKVAEEEWHHPDISFGWGRVEVTFTTHSIGGLAENDFIMAAKVNELEK